MAGTITQISSLLVSVLRGERGIQQAAGDLQMSVLTGAGADSSIFEIQAPPELVEKTGNIKYPCVHVYCDKLQNTLREKFRRFSGTADLNIEVRVTHDHLDGLQQQLRDAVETLTTVLERNRGAWSNTTWYPGAYEVTFSPVRRGGKNYLQSARIRLEVLVQSD